MFTAVKASVFTAVNRQASKEHICPTVPLEHLMFSTENSFEDSFEWGCTFINALEELHKTPHSICVDANAHPADETR